MAVVPKYYPPGKLTGDLDLNSHDVSGWVGESRRRQVPYGGIIKNVGTTLYGYKADGTLVSSGTCFGTIFNALVDALRGANTYLWMQIVVDITEGVGTTTSALLYTGMQVTGLGIAKLTTATVIPIFLAEAQESGNRSILLDNLALYYSGSSDYTCAHIELNDPAYCQITRVFTTLGDSVTGTGSSGGVKLLHVNSIGTFLNYIEKCHLSMIYLDAITDSWISKNTICSWEKNAHAIHMVNVCNNIKISKNHIICPGIGLFLPAATTIYGLKLEGNWFEPQDGWSSGETQYALSADTVIEESIIANNHITNMGAMGFNFNGGIVHSVISGNSFWYCNLAQNANYRCISFGGESGINAVTGNVGYCAGYSTKAPFIIDSNYNAFSGNVCHGTFSASIASKGANSTDVGGVYILT